MNLKDQPWTDTQPSSPKELVHPKSPPIPAEAQGEGEQAVYLAPDSPTLKIVTMSCGWHQHLGGILKMTGDMSK